MDAGGKPGDNAIGHHDPGDDHRKQKQPHRHAVPAGGRLYLPPVRPWLRLQSPIQLVRLSGIFIGQRRGTGFGCRVPHGFNPAGGTGLPQRLLVEAGGRVIDILFDNDRRICKQAIDPAQIGFQQVRHLPFHRIEVVPIQDTTFEHDVVSVV